MKKNGCDFYLGIILGTFLGLGLLTSCAEKELDPNDPIGSYAIAKEPFDDGSYEIAIKKLGEFKSRFPYSRFSVEAELLMANSHFELEHYEEAAMAYAQFAKLHPKHPQVAFALYRIGESYWADAPEAIDRDQAYTAQALKEWEELVVQYPDSPFASKAKKKMAIGRQRLAQALEFSGNFYCKMEKFHACAYKFERLLANHQLTPAMNINALTQLVKAYTQLVEQKRRDPNDDSNLYVKNHSAAELAAQAAAYGQQQKNLKK